MTNFPSLVSDVIILVILPVTGRSTHSLASSVPVLPMIGRSTSLALPPFGSLSLKEKPLRFYLPFPAQTVICEIRRAES